MEQHDGQEAILQRTLQVWQPRTDRELTPEDAREIVENVVGFFSLLLEWDAQTRSRHCEADVGDVVVLEQDGVVG